MKKKEVKINQKKKNIKKTTSKEKTKDNVIKEKEYKIEFNIIKETQKLKINLIILDKNKDNYKEFYTKLISINELITLNNFFEQFNDYLEAFSYLINNYIKIDENKIRISNNNQISIILIFSVEKNNNIYEEEIELTLNNKDIKLKKTAPNISSIINNLKISLENFNLSIKELKTIIDKDKIDKDKKINALENNINIKLKQILNEGKFNDLKLKTDNFEKNASNAQINNKINEIYSKLEEYNKEIKKIKKEKSNNELINKIKNLEEKVKSGVKSEKSNENDNSLRNSKSKKNEENINIINMDTFIEDKINEIFNNKMKLLDEKLQIINNKVINLERGQNKLYEKNRNEESFIKDASFNFGDSIIYDKYDKKIQNLNNNLNTKIKKLANKLNVNIKDIDVDNSEINNNNIIDDKTNDFTINDIKDLNIKLMNDINIKMKNMNNEIDSKVKNTLEKFSNEIVNNKMNEIKQELFSLINKVNERGKEDYKELNNKIALFKNEIIKITDVKNNNIDSKIKIIDSRTNKLLKDNQMFLEKINYFDIKIKNNDNKLKAIDNKIETNQNNNPNNNSNNNIKTNNNNSLNNSYIFSSSKNSQNINNANEETDTNNKKNNVTYIISSNLNIGNQEKNIDIDSNIIKKEEQTENYFLFSKMKEANPYNRIIKYTLVYRATRDGDSSKNFHSKCDFIGPNITLIKTKNGHIFGGFTYKGWKHLFKDIKKDEPDFGTDLKDEKAFGFSISEQKVYKNGKPNEPAIFCNNNYGPVFKNNFFKIYDEFLKKGGICGKIEESNFIGQEKDYELNGGEEKFEIEEMEVFQIALK